MKSLFKNLLVAALLVPLLAFATTPVRDHGLPYTTTGTPSNILGNPGDVALDPATGTLYLKDATAGWQASYTPSASSYNPASVAITGGSINGTTVGLTTPLAGSFTTLSASGNSTLAAVTATSMTSSGLTAKSFVYSGVGGLISTTSAPTNGQLLIGSTGNAPVAATLTGTANQINITNGAGSITASIPNTLAIPGTVTSVNGVSTVANGLAIEVAHPSFLTQTASLPNPSLLYTVPAGLGGRYRVTMNCAVVTPATTSSTLPNITIAWTDGRSGGTPSANIGSSSTGNTTSSISLGTITVYAQAGTAINASSAVAYASVGATSMAYSCDFQVDYLGT